MIQYNHNKTQKDVENMYYEINIALNGKHFFATDERSITNKDKLEDIYNVFKEKFPKEEGYDISVTRFELAGKYINMEQERI
jgi:hypothetical protein